MSKRVIECNICGEPLAAANDEELVRAVRGHIEAEHEGADVGRGAHARDGSGRGLRGWGQLGGACMGAL